MTLDFKFSRSCYVFSAVAIVESYYARKNPGKLLSFSEQQLLDCPKRSDPCGGGYPNKGKFAFARLEPIFYRILKLLKIVLYSFGLCEN